MVVYWRIIVYPETVVYLLTVIVYREILTQCLVVKSVLCLLSCYRLVSISMES